MVVVTFSFLLSSTISQAQPDPKTDFEAALKASLNASKDPKSLSIANDSASEGFLPETGVSIFQKKSMVQITAPVISYSCRMSGNIFQYCMG